MPNVPLILTLTLDADTQLFFNTLRRAHFPPERNYLDAHLTLFHHLPPHEPQIILNVKLAVKTYTPMPLQVTEIKSIGNGVAFKIECARLMQLHHHLQKEWAQWLIPQDTQKLWPHVTVQNKVDAEEAKLLKAQLEQDFKPFEGVGIGLSLFEYHNGPWELVNHFEFGGL